MLFGVKMDVKGIGLSGSNVKGIKKQLRYEIWNLMEELNIAGFPRPVHGRIPNFLGANIAANKLRLLSEFKSSKVVKVNPDSPQHHVRLNALIDGKLVLMPTPKLREGFILLDPSKIPNRLFNYASSIKGALELGEKVSLSSLPKVDLIVVGSVAVNVRGVRLGKGGGFAELEYAILKEVKCIDDSVKVITTVHDVQVLNREIPLEPHDLVVDVIVTPSKIINVINTFKKPEGIYWDLVTESMLREIPILKELKSLTR